MIDNYIVNGITVDLQSDFEVTINKTTLDGRSTQDGTPTPNSPSEVKCIEGKNLFKVVPNTSEGLTSRINSDGSVNISGTATDTWATTTSYFDRIYEPGDYIFSINPVNNVARFCVRFRNSDGSGNQTFYLNKGTSWIKLTLTKQANGVYFYNSQLTAGTHYDFDEFIQLEKGSVATPYVPYQNIAINVSNETNMVQHLIDLKENKLCSLPNGVKDELIVENGKAKIVKRVGIGLINCTAFGTLGNGNKYAVALTPSDKNKNRSDAKSFMCSNATANFTYKDGTIYQNPSNFVIVGDADDTLASMKQKYNDGEIYYELAEPYEIDLGSTDEIQTFKNITHVSNSENTNMTIDYMTEPWALDKLEDEDKSIFIKGDCTIKTKVIINDYTSDNDLVLTERDSVKTWTLTDERYVPDFGFIGQFVAKQLDGKLQNVTDDFNIEDKYLKLYMGVATFGSSKTQWYKLGTYIIDNPKDDEVQDNTKFTAYDLTVKFNKRFDADYKDGVYTESFNEKIISGASVTLGWLLRYVCAQANVSLGSKTFINNDFVITTNQLTSGETCRDVVKYISELAFGYAEIDYDDKLYIRNMVTDYVNVDTYNTITNDQYYKLTTQKNVYGPINRVYIGLQDVNGGGIEISDPSSIATNGETSLYIYNNPLVMSTDIEKATELQRKAIEQANILYGISYRPFETETIGTPWFKAYQPIKIVDMEGNTSTSYPFVNALKYTGHIKSDVSAESNTKIEDTYGYDKSVAHLLKNIGINVDRMNEEIKIVNKKYDDLAESTGQEIDISQYYTKQEINYIVEGTPVDGVVVTSLQTATNTLDKDGLTVGRTDSATTTNVNSNGMIIKNASNDTQLLTINNSGVKSENLTARTYLNFGTHGRFEKYKNPHYSYGSAESKYNIGCFWVEGDDE